LAELLGGRPFFKGRDYVDQLNQILHYLGTPTEETLSRIGSQRVSNQPLTQTKVKAQDYVRNLPFMPKIPFNHIFPKANPQGLPPTRNRCFSPFCLVLVGSFMFGLRGADL
jgi:mitogen-activated protein kinase 7